MSLFGKALVVLLLTLPVAAYVAGSLTGLEAELPERQTPVLVDDSRPAPAADETKTPRGPRDGDDRGDDDGRRGGDDADDDDDDVRVVRPDPDDLDDDRDDDRGDDGDDDSDDG